jgi:3-oxoacyl-[acyl-carrier-protein] synthase-3
MTIRTVENVRLAGLSACVPKGRAANVDSTLLSPEDRQKLIKTTGIEARRVATKDQCTSDLCFAAADELLKQLQWKRDEIDALVFVTQTADFIVPATSYLLQQRLGIGRGATTFDINLGCSGFTHGLSIVASMLAGSGMKKGLLLCGDTPSKSVSPDDRSAALLFGDAGTAAALETVPGQSLVFDVGCDGTGWQAINIPDGGYRHPFSSSSLETVRVDEGIARNKCQLILDGVEIFNFSLREVPPTVRNVLEHTRQAVDSVDAFVFHQANQMMNELIRKKLKVPPEKFPYSLREFGNTSSASIPVTLVTQLGSRLAAEQLKLVLCGFGVGLSWSTAAVSTDRIACPALIEQ